MHWSSDQGTLSLKEIETASFRHCSDFGCLNQGFPWYKCPWASFPSQIQGPSPPPPPMVLVQHKRRAGISTDWLINLSPTQNIYTVGLRTSSSNYCLHAGILLRLWHTMQHCSKYGMQLLQTVSHPQNDCCACVVAEFYFCNITYMYNNYFRELNTVQFPHCLQYCEKCSTICQDFLK